LIVKKRELEALAENCDKKNFRLYFHVHYKLASVINKIL